jgi:hypothetical protein
MLQKITLIALIISLTSITSRAQETAHLNLSFENWDDSSMFNSTIGEEGNYSIQDAKKGILDNWIKYGGLSVQTTDATDGDYAIVLNNWYGTHDDYIASGSNGSLQPNACYNCGTTINFRPKTFSGDYKINLLGTTIDSLRGFVSITLTKYNDSLDIRDTIGHGQITLLETDSTYQDFSFPISYTNENTIPDSVIISISLKGSGGSQDTQQCINCMYFFIDNLKLDTTDHTQGLLDQNNDPHFISYPNPFQNHLFIENNTDEKMDLALVNMIGEKVSKWDLMPYTRMKYDVSSQSKGFYILSNGQQFIRLMKY